MTFTIARNLDLTYRVETKNVSYCGINYDNIPAKELGDIMKAIAEFVNNVQGEACLFEMEA